MLKARAAGYRSRAVYKLLELDDRLKLFRSDQIVVDLGAAPGGWSQVARERLGNSGRIIALDLLEMAPIEGVECLVGDFTQDEVLAVLEETLLQNGGAVGVDLVISDMAPNLTGAKAVDQPAMIYLAELAIDLTGQIMKPEGVFIAKIFQGEGFDQFVRHVRTVFNTVSLKKPDASRAKSREVYLVAKGLKPN